MAMVIELIAKIEKEFPIDRSRIYVTGLSMGGYGTWDLIARFPHRFAAAVPVCGGGDPETASQIKHIPLWAFHGALDNVVPPGQSRVMVRALQDAGGTPGYTEYPDVKHDSWVYAFREPHLLPWLFNQHLGEKSKVK
jgi:predicted peptidase